MPKDPLPNDSFPNNTFVDATVAMIATWHDVTPPNDAALRMVADLRKIIGDFEAQRGTLLFEDEPSSFEAALLATAAPERMP